MKLVALALVVLTFPLLARAQDAPPEAPEPTPPDDVVVDDGVAEPVPVPADVDGDESDGQNGEDPRDLPETAPPAPDANPAGGDDDATGIADALRSRRPPRFLRAYRVEGTLRDPEGVVRGFLDAAVPLGEIWTDEKQIALTEFCKRMGYHVTILNQPVGNTDVDAVLNLQPVTLVRRINATVADRKWYAFVTDALFDEDIVQRMRIRPGDALELDTASREEQLRGEQRRLVEFLRDEGFFDADVKISAVPDGRYGVSLQVTVRAGEPYTVGKVTVVGNREVPTADIVELFRHTRLYRWKKRFNRDQFKNDVDKVVELYQKRGFPGVRVRTDFGRTSFKRNTETVEFTVTVRERRRVEIVFEGNRKLQDRQLRVQLTLDEEGSYDDFEIERSAQALRAYYQSRGYFEASVLWERFTFRLPGQLFDRIVFTVDEGPQMKVASVDFRGNQYLSSAKLRSIVKTREFPRVGFLASGGFATSLSLQQDADRIRAAYRLEGFANVEVDYEVTRDRRLLGNAPALAAAIVSEAPAEGLFVRFVVREAQRQQVASVEFAFEGEHRQSAEQLRQLVSLRRGAAFTAGSLEDDTSALRRHYFELGFPQARVKTEIRAACKVRYVAEEDQCVGGEFADRLVVVHRVRENQFVRFGQVALRGNFRTRDWVLRDQLKLRPDAPFTLGRAERAQRGLRGSGLFSTVRFDFVGLEEDDPGDVVNVVVHVEERFDHRFELRAGGGLSTDQNFFTEAGVTFPHLFGIGARLDLQGQAGPELQTIQTKLTLPPWILRRAVGFGVRSENDLFVRRENTERFGTLQTLGVNAGLSREGSLGTPWEGWFAALRYTFRIRDRAEDLVRPAGPSDDIQQTQVLTKTGAIGPLVVVDRRRDRQGRINPLAAVRGFRLEFSALFADTLLGGDDRFIKLGFRGQHVLSLGPRVLVTNGARYDQGVPLDGALLPEVERFFAGGDNTVRGFEEDRLLGELVVDDLPPLAGVSQFSIRPAGGNVRFIHNLDVQFTVWDKGPILEFPWASAVFVDTGIVTNSLDDVGITDLRHSLGIAFWRMLTPFGGFSFEWAVPLDQALGDNPRGRFHFNLGFVFQ